MREACQHRNLLSLQTSGKTETVKALMIAAHDARHAIIQARLLIQQLQTKLNVLAVSLEFFLAEEAALVDQSLGQQVPTIIT